MTMLAGVRTQQAASTRAALMDTARRLFAEKGYHGASTPELSAAAGVSRGALYHHFGDKETLFEAVFRQVETELVAEAGGAVAGLMDDPWRQLLTGIETFLGVIAARRDVQRILLLDGPVVLGWSRWRELGAQFTLGQLTRTLERLADSGLLAAQPVGPLSHLIIAALNEAALLIAHSSDPETTRAEVTAALRTLVSGLRAPP